ncbi:MAG: type II toxin-antitoxin system VapC family toxin [Chromatiaceae bacterium]|jgi:predicted nucleic acid-binding protein
MVILDTNVVSELLRAAPAPGVDAWLAGQDGADIYLTAISEAELRYGVATMAKGKRSRLLSDAVDGMLREDFRDRILPFDSAAAKQYAGIGAERRAAGRPISQFDCQIAAIARAHGAAIATRNIGDFEGCGVQVIDPWRHLGGD